MRASFLPTAGRAATSPEQKPACCERPVRALNGAQITFRHCARAAKRCCPFSSTPSRNTTDGRAARARIQILPNGCSCY